MVVEKVEGGSLEGKPPREGPFLRKVPSRGKAYGKEEEEDSLCSLPSAALGAKCSCDPQRSRKAEGEGAKEEG